MLILTQILKLWPIFTANGIFVGQPKASALSGYAAGMSKMFVCKQTIKNYFLTYRWIVQRCIQHDDGKAQHITRIRIGENVRI